MKCTPLCFGIGTLLLLLLQLTQPASWSLPSIEVSRFRSLLSHTPNPTQRLVASGVSPYSAQTGSQRDPGLPRIYLLASHATAGNLFARRLFMRLTGIGAGSTYKERENPQPLFTSPNGWTLYVDPKNPPLAALPTLMKTHHSKVEKFGKFEAIHGVVLLVRNPGDQVLHNYLRWAPCRAVNERTARARCYRERGSSGCAKVLTFPVRQWSHFHTEWLEFAKHSNFPTFILHYEDLVARPMPTLTHLLQFLNLSTIKAPINDPPEKTADDLGREIGQHCDPAVVERFVAEVASLAEELGYKWDDGKQKYVWSMSSPLSTLRTP